MENRKFLKGSIKAKRISDTSIFTSIESESWPKKPCEDQDVVAWRPRMEGDVSDISVSYGWKKLEGDILEGTGSVKSVSFYIYRFL